MNKGRGVPNKQRTQSLFLASGLGTVLNVKRMLNIFEPDGPKRLCDVVTADETWLSSYYISN